MLLLRDRKKVFMLINLNLNDCENPIVVNNYPQSETEEFYLICNFTPVFENGLVKTSTDAQSYIYAGLNHDEEKSFHKTGGLNTKESYFYQGQRVFSIDGVEKVGYFGYPQDQHSASIPYLWAVSLIIFAVAFVGYVLEKLENPVNKYGMCWWQEVVFFVSILLLLAVNLFFLGSKIFL